MTTALRGVLDVGHRGNSRVERAELYRTTAIQWMLCAVDPDHMEKAKLVRDPHDMYVLYSMVGVSLLSFPVVAVCVRLW